MLKHLLFNNKNVNRQLFSSLTKISTNETKTFHNEIIKCIENVQKINPLVHCITNRVTTEKIANSLLAFGASPAVIDNPDEVEEFCQISSCTYLNLGLGSSQIKNFKIIEKLRKKIMKDKLILIIDPIAVGATKYRTNMIKKVILKCKPNVIKGNLSEIYYLDKEDFFGKGVDSGKHDISDEDQINIAKNVAKKYSCTVVLTSKHDIIANSNNLHVAKINLDMKILTKITGTGCSIGALCAAAVSVYSQNPLIACSAATLLYKLAALKSYDTVKYPGTLKEKIIDNIYFYSNNPNLLNLDILEVFNLS